MAPSCYVISGNVTEFSLSFNGSRWVFLCKFTQFLLSFIEFHSEFLSRPSFDVVYLVLPSFTEFHSVLLGIPSFHAVYLVLPNLIEFHLVLLGRPSLDVVYLVFCIWFNFNMFAGLCICISLFIYLVWPSLHLVLLNVTSFHAVYLVLPSWPEFHLNWFYSLRSQPFLIELRNWSQLT